MKTTSHFYQKVLSRPELAQVVLDVSVLEKYLQSANFSVMRTDTVGRVKAASWSLDFGIAPDEAKIHVKLADFAHVLPESEREHWLDHVDGSHFSENYLKMQGGGVCIDDGGLRQWGEEAGLI